MNCPPLDLGMCPYLDSGGLNVIVRAVHDVGPEGWVGLVNCSPMVRRLLELIGLTLRNELRMFDTFGAAERAVAGPH